MKKLIVALSLVLSTSTFAQAPEGWVRMFSIEGGVVDGRKGSFNLSSTIDGAPAVLGVVRITRAGKPTVTRQLGITLKDCAQGFGTVREYDLQDKFIQTHDFVLTTANEGPPFDLTASIMCAVAADMVRKQGAPNNMPSKPNPNTI